MSLRLNTGFKSNNEPDDNKAELTEHLAELRTRIIRACGYCAIGMMIMYAFYGPIYGFLAKPITSALASHPANQTFNGALVFNNFAEAFFLRLQISAVGGLIIAVPLIVMELWGFIAPGLTRNERKAITLVAPMSVFLFFLGVGCAFAVTPMAIRWFLSYIADVPGAILLQNPLTYIVFIVKMMLAFGLVFQLPVILMFLGKVGIINSAMMIKYWRQITVVLFTMAMVVAPSNDPGTMLMLAVPLTILFLASINLVKLVEPKKKS